MSTFENERREYVADLPPDAQAGHPNGGRYARMSLNEVLKEEAELQSIRAYERRKAGEQKP